MSNGAPFNTNYWSFGSQYLAGSPYVTADSADNDTAGVLPAMWWLGGLIILIVIRVAYELMD